MPVWVLSLVALAPPYPPSVTMSSSLGLPARLGQVRRRRPSCRHAHAIRADSFIRTRQPLLTASTSASSIRSFALSSTLRAGARASTKSKPSSSSSSSSASNKAKLAAAAARMSGPGSEAMELGEAFRVLKVRCCVLAGVGSCVWPGWAGRWVGPLRWRARERAREREKEGRVGTCKKGTRVALSGFLLEGRVGPRGEQPSRTSVLAWLDTLGSQANDRSELSPAERASSSGGSH